MKFLVLILVFASASTIASEKQFKSVIGEDTRARITARNHRPIHDSIGLVEIDYEGHLTGRCTGTVISPRHVLTSAHCLIHKGEFGINVRFIPGINDPVSTAHRPYGTMWGSKFRIIKSYVESNAVKHDLGLVTFAENLPVDPVPMTVLPKNVNNIIIAGYPGDKETGELWEGRGKRMRSFLGLGFPSEEHDVDTYNGQSGAAVRAVVNRREVIVGIHSQGGGSTLFDKNEALFFTRGTIQLLRKWMAKD